MANVIEILINAKNNAAAELSQTRSQVGQLSSALGIMTPTVLGAATAIISLGVAAVGATAKLAGTVEQLDRISNKTGLGIESIQVYRQILEEAGGSSESLTQGLMFLSRSIATNDPILAKLGITTKDTGEAFRQLIGILGRSADETVRNQVAFALLGRGSSDLVANAAALSSGFEEMHAKMSASGAMITDKLAPSLRNLDSDLDTLGRNWKGFWNNAVATAVPAANQIVIAMNRILEAARNNPMLLPGGIMGMTAGAFAQGAPSGMLSPHQMGAAGDTSRILKDALDKNTQAVLFLNQAFRESGAAAPGLRNTLPGLPGFSVDQPVPFVAPQLDAMTQVKENWRDFANSIVDSAQIVNDTLGALFNGLSSGFNQVFQGLLTQGQTLKSAMTTLFSALVSEILAQLARLAAAKVFSFILSVLGIPLSAGGGGGGGGGPRMGDPGFRYPTTRSAGPTVNIHAIDERSFAEHFRSYSGSGRVSERRLAEAGEW